MRRSLLALAAVVVTGVAAVAPAAGVRRADAEARRHARLSRAWPGACLPERSAR